jgi:hypothetical protein
VWMLRRILLTLFAFTFLASSAVAAAEAPGLPVTIAWDPNSEPSVIGYRVYIGTAPSVYTETVDTGSATSFVYQNGAAGLTYYFTVAAYVEGAVEGPQAPEISTVIAPASSDQPPDPGDGESPPPDPAPAPGIVLEPAAVSDSTVVLTWRPVGTFDLIEYLVEVGSAPGGTDIYNAPVGTRTSFSATVTSGSHFARVRARTPTDSSVVSNEVGFSVGATGCAAVPKTPRDMSASIAADRATFGWKHAAGATSYVLQVGTAQGRSELFNQNVGNTRVVKVIVPAGTTIYARVIAVNACGQSAASAEVRVP